MKNKIRPVTGVPFTIKAFRGTGRQDPNSVYTNKSLGPIFGKARYWAITEAVAKKFGPDIETEEIKLRKPWVLDSDEALGDLVGAESIHLPSNLDDLRLEDLDNLKTLPSRLEDRIKALISARAKLEAHGFDGVIIMLESDSRTKLREWFGDTQIVEFQ